MINSRFHINRLLGEGRSKVFLCSDRFHPNARYAIKILPSTASEEELFFFRNEFVNLKKIIHPNIVKVFEFGIVLQTDIEDVYSGIETGSSFFVMEYCEGVKISNIDFKRHQGCLLKAVEQISSFLFFLHISNYIYFDLKCENILVSADDNNFNLKFIDFGLAENINKLKAGKPRGTAVYIAPEFIENANIDHKVDLYSFGVLLYKLVYGYFPVTGDNELSIYSQKLKGQFDYPISVFPEKIITIIKTLLATDPADRFKNTLQVLNYINSNIDVHVNDWFQATTYIERKNELLEIENYLGDPERYEVLVIKGDPGSGRTSFAQKLNDLYSHIIYIENLSSQDPKYFPLFFISKILYNEKIYKNLEPDIINKIQNAILGESVIEFETLKVLLVRLTNTEKIAFIIDDFNLLDEVIKEYLFQVFPVLQVNKCKIILLTENKNEPDFIPLKSKSERVISTFSPEEIHNFLKYNFASFFPKSKLEVLILRYSDHLPGNIILFIRDLILFEVIRFTDSEIILAENQSNNNLSWSQELIYENRVANISATERKILEIISAIEINVDSSIFDSFPELNRKEIINILEGLKQKNILISGGKHSNLQFSSIGLKAYVYAGINGKQKLHKEIAGKVKFIKDFNIVELSRQFELSGDFDNCYLTLLSEIDRAKKVSAYSYLKKLFSRLSEFTLSANLLVKVKKEYIEVLIKSGEPGAALRIIDEFKDVDYAFYKSCQIDKGICLINTGKAEEGKILLLEELERIEDSNKKMELTLEIANAELNTNDFENVFAICKEIISNQYATREQYGRAFNFLGIVEIYKNDNPDGAIVYFDKALTEFEAAGLPHRIARLKINMGNIFNMKGEHKKAEEYWNSSLFINTSIGDIEQEALLLMNYGIFNYDMCNYEKSQEFYYRAGTIFATTGNLNGEALALVNSSETHYACCEYSKSLNVLNKARKIFISTSNREEEASCIYLMLFNYYTLNSFENFDFYYNEYNKIVHSFTPGEKHEAQLRFMELLRKISLNDSHDVQVIADYKEIMNKFYNSDNLTDFNFAAFVLIKFLIGNSEFKEAAELLSDERVKKAFSKNIVYNSGRLYLASQLTKRYPFGDEPYQNLLFNAYDIIKAQSITDLTWQILFSIGESYFERGLYQNALTYTKQAALLIYFIAENIDDEFLRISYLANKDRKNIFDKRDELEKNIARL